MRNIFKENTSYNAMQTLELGGLANNCKPLLFNDMFFVRSQLDKAQSCTHIFTHKGERLEFEDALVNTGIAFDNSLIVVERNLSVRNTIK